jgi:uncharacterized LabA/DUF88 family protein
MEATAYVDGFNLYHGAIKGTAFKWLDLHGLAQALLPDHAVTRVRYFTARVDDRPDDPRQSQRQDVYLRALRTRPQISLHFGQFRTRRKPVRLADPSDPAHPIAFALVTEEKGTDVSLGAHLVWDAFRRDVEGMDTALVISNDSDLQEPVDMARQLGIRVVVVNPHRHTGQAQHLFGDEVRRLRLGHLAKAQFPHQLLDQEGRVNHVPARMAAVTRKGPPFGGPRGPGPRRSQVGMCPL